MGQFIERINVNNFIAIIGYNGIDFWDVIFGDNENDVRAQAEISAAECFISEGNMPTIDIGPTD